jgi:hypothetical protein
MSFKYRLQQSLEGFYWQASEWKQQVEQEATAKTIFGVKNISNSDQQY